MLVLYFSSVYFFFFSSRRRHTRCLSDWSSDVCSSDLAEMPPSELLVSVMPAGTTGSGAGMMCQAEPSQCSISVRAVSLRPTAQAFPPQIGRASCRERVVSAGGGVTKEERETQKGERVS